jgi:hypothetical protein
VTDLYIQEVVFAIAVSRRLDEDTGILAGEGDGRFGYHGVRSIPDGPQDFRRSNLGNPQGSCGAKGQNKRKGFHHQTESSIRTVNG